MTEENKNQEEEKPQMFLRLSKNQGGLYFFSPSGKIIYYMNTSHVVDLINGERDFVCIGKQKTLIGAEKNE